MQYRPRFDRVKWTIYIKTDIASRIDDLKYGSKIYKSDFVEQALLEKLERMERKNDNVR